MGKEDQGLEDRLLWSNLFAQSRNSALTFCGKNKFAEQWLNAHRAPITLAAAACSPRAVHAAFLVVLGLICEVSKGAWRGERKKKVTPEYIDVTCSQLELMRALLAMVEPSTDLRGFVFCPPISVLSLLVGHVLKLALIQQL